MKKLCILFFAVVFALVFAGCGSSGDSGGSGEGGGGSGGGEEDIACVSGDDGSGVIVICTAEDLNAVRNEPAADYMLGADILLADYSTGEGWEPLGDNSAPFTGTFDGNGHKITGLFINRIGSALGLFGRADGAEIRNLGVEVAEGGLTGTNDASDNRISIGGIVGSMSGGIIENSYSKGSISANARLNAFVGGIVGSMSGGSIKNSYSMGNISAVATVGGSTAYSGGIAGDMLLDSSVENSYSTANVSANALLDAYSGGIVGSMSGGSIKNSYSMGNISAADTGYAAYSGGIVGKMYWGSVESSYSSGDITSFVRDSSAYSGGIAGGADNSSITKSYSTGDTTSFSEFGLASSAGIVGHANSSSMTDTYSRGDITSSAHNESYSGGIVGYFYDSSIKKSYSTGDITSSSNYASSGGIAGITEYSAIEYCAAINLEIKADHYAGRITGYFDGYTSDNNFALNTMQATGIAFNTDSTNHGDGKSDAELQNENTYSDPVASGGLGWLFGNDGPWKMPADEYPVFYWQ